VADGLVFDPLLGGEHVVLKQKLELKMFEQWYSR